MLHVRKVLGILALLAAAVLTTIGGHRTQAASLRTLCVFPSATDTDGRMLAIAGKNRRTFELQPLRASITVPPTKNVFWIGLFDGETGLDDLAQFNPDLGNWDFVDPLAAVVPQLRVRLYADPNGDQSSLALIAEWFGNQANVPPPGALWRLVDDDTARMPNNAWWDVEIATSNIARTSSTSPFRYLLDVQIDDPNTSVDFLSSFKLRTIDAEMRVLPGLVGLIVPISTQRDRLALYPGWDGVTMSALVDSNCNPGAPLLNSPYNGTWEFLLDATGITNLTDMVIWNGDFDHTAEFGFPCITETTTDTDDLDSPPFPTEPWFVPMPSAQAEGARAGVPADDNASPIVRRHPSVVLQLIDPQGRLFVDPNPSGDQEWEKFHVTANPTASLSDADYGPAIPKSPVPPSGTLPSGIWKLRIVGLDAQNLVFLSLPTALRCEEIRFPDIGDEVWYDMDRDGVRDWFEQHMGIGGVRLDLFRGSRFLGSTFSDSTGDLGRYFFRDVLPNQRYTVRVPSINFATGGVLEGMSTSTGNQLQRFVGEADDLTFDFGYFRRRGPGVGTPGFWSNHPELWPVEAIALGPFTFSKPTAIQIMQQSTSGDMTYVLAAHLIAAKLNVYAGNDPSCIQEWIGWGDRWMTRNPLGPPLGPTGSQPVSAGSPEWQQPFNGEPSGQSIKNQLDLYNNGKLCAPAR